MKLKKTTIVMLCIIGLMLLVNLFARLCTPAADFYTDTLTGKSEARLAYVLGEDRLVRALTLLKHGLTAYQSRDPNARHTQSPN